MQPHIIEEILNHRGGHKAGIAGIYNRSTYEREVKAALALWQKHVRSLVEGSGSKVLTLPVSSGQRQNSVCVTAAGGGERQVDGSKRQETPFT
jgi:hypothetical protein